MARLWHVLNPVGFVGSGRAILYDGRCANALEMDFIMTLVVVSNKLPFTVSFEDDVPQFNIPTQPSSTFDGLKPNTYSNALNGNPIFVSRPSTARPPANHPNVVPTPDPHEEFQFITVQLFGTATPAPGAVTDMSSFLLLAPDASGANAAQV